jgi:hypothetical protein
MGCKPSLAKDQKARIPLCLIVGLIDREERVKHSFRPNRTLITLHGQFLGQNLENDNRFWSHMLQVSDSKRKQIARFAARSPESQFSVMIYAEPATNPTGYRYVVQPFEDD